MREKSDSLVGRKKRGPLYKVGAWLLVLQVLLVSLVTDVVPVAAAGMGQQKIFTTAESVDQTQTQTFTIPGLKKLNGATVNTGSVEVVTVDGEKVTVKVTNGVRTRRVQTGGAYTPGTNQTEIDSRTSSVNSFPASIVKNGVTLTKDGGPSSYQTGGIYTPAETESFYEYTMGWPDDEYMTWGGPNGAVYHFNTGSEIVDMIYVGGGDNMLTWYGHKTIKPAVDTRTYSYIQKYKGTKIIKESDTRTYDNYYQYAVTFDYKGDTTAPTIVLTANPTVPTNQDVTITAKIKDIEKTTFNSYESTKNTQTQTFKIPQMKKLDKVTVNNGNVEVVSVDGEKVTVKVTNGVRTRREQTGGVYRPPSTQIEIDSLTNTTNSFPATVVKNGITLTKSGSVTTKIVGGMGSVSKHERIERWNGSNDFPSHLSYDKDGYTGTLSKNGDYMKDVSYSESMEPCGWGHALDGCGKWRTVKHTQYGQEYSGIVTNPNVDTSTTHYTQNYRGEKVIPVVDTRTYQDYYQYAVTFVYEGEIAEKKWAKGPQDIGYFKTAGETLVNDQFTVSENGTYTVYARDAAGNEAVETIKIGNIYKDPPTITLKANPVTLTNKDVVVMARVVSPIGIAEKKWAKGNHDTVYFEKKGTALGGSFKVTENGVYTAFAKDKVGNMSVKTIPITNINKIPPAIPTFTATPTTETKGPVAVTIYYSGESVLKQYRTVTGTGSGVWKEYLEPISLTRNGIVEARGQDQAGNWSAVSRIVITNIVKENNGGNPPGDGSGSGGNYEVPLQQKPMDDSGMQGSNRTFKAEFVSDLFFTTKYTGFMTGYPYANKVRESILNGGAMPSLNAVVNEGTAKSKTAYESKTGQTFKDEWMFTESEENVESLQRYAIPITPLSDLKPGETYQNDMELVDMGLSDLGFEYDQTFSFDHYLFGSGADEAWVIEQPESRVKVDSADVKTIVITKEQRNKIIGEVKERPTEDKLHNFRVTDRNFTEMIRKIVGF
ncbi:hypothetical protein H7992_04970 [Sporosarcina sp. resist]|uniref:hypothetical protein n=1 Tax=Sporosarcina sp. resist TaxID=2762563 RepID=UPI00164E7972|nr:hypothetical protein [Sporosarcina sp. resist]QNK89080.1 hypothetical protein H7992_04970 [Sporosarcina sp. resist]